MGDWLKVNGEAIYGTQATLFGAEAGSVSPTEKDAGGKPKFVPEWKWRSTTGPKKIYIELFEWPAGDFRLAKVPREVDGAYLLSAKGDVPVRMTRDGAGGISFALPNEAPSPVASVLVLKTR
jgi:alpha-L-fucosidase